MKTTKTIILVATLALFLYQCKNSNEKEVPSPTSTVSKKTETEPKRMDFSGNYVSDGYFQRNENYDWVAVSVKQGIDNIILRVRSRADKKKPTCTLDLTAKKFNDTTYIALLDQKPVKITFGENSINIATERPEDGGILHFYCSGGATVAGQYKKIDEPLDSSQVDKTIFSQVLNLQGIGFNVSVKNTNGKKELTVLPFGLQETNTPETTEIHGRVSGVETEDLNSDGSPEILVFVKNENGKKGTVIGYSTNNRKSMSRIYFPPVEDNDKINNGYEGHDEFSIIETYLAQRFPIAGSNNIRQITYKLEDGEAMRRFEINQVSDFPNPNH